MYLLLKGMFNLTDSLETQGGFGDHVSCRALSAGSWPLFSTCPRPSASQPSPGFPKAAPLGTPGSQPKSLPLPASGPNSSASTRVTCAQTSEAPWPRSGRAERFCPRGPSPSCGTLGMSGATPWGGPPLLQSWENSPCLTGHWSAGRSAGVWPQRDAVCTPASFI